MAACVRDSFWRSSMSQRPQIVFFDATNNPSSWVSPATARARGFHAEKCHAHISRGEDIPPDDDERVYRHLYCRARRYIAKLTRALWWRPSNGNSCWKMQPPYIYICMRFLFCFWRALFVAAARDVVCPVLFFKGWPRERTACGSFSRKPSDRLRWSWWRGYLGLWNDYNFVYSFFFAWTLYIRNTLLYSCCNFIKLFREIWYCTNNYTF